MGLFSMFLAPCNSLTLTMFGREIRRCSEVAFGMGFFWGKSNSVMCLVVSVVVRILMGTFSGIVLFRSG